MKIIIHKLLPILLLMVSGQTFGQEYSFKVKYGMVHAGMAKLVQKVEAGILQSTFNINSSPWLSNLWVLSDSIQSSYDVNMGGLLSHTKAIHEGSYHRNYKVKFLDSNLVKINQKTRRIEAEELKDIPSLLYELSKTDLTVGDTLHYRLWDGKSYGNLSLLIGKTPRPSIFRPFVDQGWHLTPLNSTAKSRENQIRLTVLLSESKPHLPLKVQINTKYGNVLMRLEQN